MTKLSPWPGVKLSRLRDIGWVLWDPIGMLGSDRKWGDEECRSFADEYDSYLISAASQLRRGAPSVAVVDYLVWVETECMALGKRPDTQERAEAVVKAILSDKEIWTWPDEQGRFM